MTFSKSNDQYDGTFLHFVKRFMQATFLFLFAFLAYHFINADDGGSKVSLNGYGVGYAPYVVTAEAAPAHGGYGYETSVAAYGDHYAYETPSVAVAEATLVNSEYGYELPGGIYVSYDDRYTYDAGSAGVAGVITSREYGQHRSEDPYSYHPYHSNAYLRRYLNGTA